MQQKIPIKVGDEGGEIEGDPLKMALDRRKNEEVSSAGIPGISLNDYQDVEGVRGKLIVAVSSLTRLLGAEQLQQKKEVIPMAWLFVLQLIQFCHSPPLRQGVLYLSGFSSSASHNRPV